MFKSMKLITVMIGARMFFQKEFNRFEYIASPILVVSAALFSLGDTQEALRFNMVGTTAVVLSLVFDSCHSNYQQYVLQLHRDTILELLVYSNFIAAVMATVVGLLALEAGDLYMFMLSHSFVDVMSWFVVRVVCLYIGVSAYAAFSKKFGAVAVTTVTTIRKILTVILSYLLWPEAKSFAKQHAIGTLLFFMSMAVNLWGIREKELLKRVKTVTG